jgi:polygalacturonase
MTSMTRSRLSRLGLFLAIAGLAGCTTLSQPAARTYDIRLFGATGDGKTPDTGAINQAIDAAAAAGGGTVVFPAGTYASYTIHLKSNVALYLDAGATLLAADPPPEGQPGGYDPPEPNPGTDRFEDFGHAHWHNSLIVGENVQNIAILGPGRIVGRGLSRGFGRKDPMPGEPRPPRPPRGMGPLDEGTATTPFGYPSPRDMLGAGIGNKSIALKNCRHVLLRDFTIYHGGHFGILATGVDNFTIDNLKIDTNRDGMDIDCCKNVRVSNCTVNSPNDDGICLKASYGLGEVRSTENVTITGCQVSGYEEGTLLDGTYQAKKLGGGTGRIKFGTEANGGFKNVTITNCIFDSCQGLALEEVDGGAMENVTVSDLVMRRIVSAPIFIRLGARLRGPDNPPMGVARRIKISNVVATEVSPQTGILISGIPGYRIEDVALSHILIEYAGGGTAEQAAREVPEEEKAYPEPGRFGIIPSWGMFARHVQGLSLDHVELRPAKEDLRPAIILDDVAGADFDHVKAQPAAGTPTVVLKNVDGFVAHNCPGLPDTRRDQPVADEKL